MFRFAAHLEAQKAVKDVLAAVPRKVTVKGYLEGAVKVIVRVSLREILTRALNPRGGGTRHVSTARHRGLQTVAQ